MRYLVAGKFRHDTFPTGDRENFLRFLKTAVAPTIHVLLEIQTEGKLLAGGLPAGSRDLVMILEIPGATSHVDVRHLLLRLPLFDSFEWTVTPLEKFEEWKEILAS